MHCGNAAETRLCQSENDGIDDQMETVKMERLAKNGKRNKQKHNRLNPVSHCVDKIISFSQLQSSKKPRNDSVLNHFNPHDHFSSLKKLINGDAVADEYHQTRDSN
jgi:hypothetical protein